MKIIPNYQLKAFNYTRLNNQPLQTNPSFGNKNKLIKEGAKAAAGAVAAGTVLAMQNGNGNEDRIPTGEELKIMLENGITYDDKLVAEVFEKYPEIVTPYACAKDNNGNYRFSTQQIYDIVKAKTRGEYPPEKIDEFMNLQRSDGSYVNDEFYERNFEIFMKSPKEYEELCNILIDGNTYIYKTHIENIITHYINYPNEIKEILQTMPRFSIEELTELGTRAGMNLHIAPKSFRTLAGLRITTDRFAFSLEEICDIIEKYELDKKEADNSEEFKSTLEMLSDLGRNKEQNSYDI